MPYSKDFRQSFPSSGRTSAISYINGIARCTFLLAGQLQCTYYTEADSRSIAITLLSKENIGTNEHHLQTPIGLGTPLLQEVFY